MEIKRDVFQAIADPTRRKIIGLLATQSMNLNTISENFEITRQAVSLHIKILEQCNLVSIRQEGRERICEAKLEKLNEVHQWTEQFSIFWTKKLQVLKQVVENSPKTPSNLPGNQMSQATKNTKIR